jgi:exopolyphosphatase / guanosine-5'-triphosphate,3'-diphosphate pyrophosphatase
MRVAVVDIGTNSTRLLVADVAGGSVTDELARESIVTRLGQGVDASGRLAPEAMDRVFAVLERYRARIDELGVERTVAVLTSAVRDSENGEEFRTAVRERYGLDARVLEGTEEAELTFLGATSERPADQDDGAIVVIDIGGGSTEFVIGRSNEVRFHTSLQAGVVRMTERHLHHDPPRPEELEALTDDVRTTIAGGVPEEQRAQATHAVAVAGTATMAAAMDLELEPYDPKKVHGHTVTVDTLTGLRDELASKTNDERRQRRGLHPDRAPTIVAGMAMLRECAVAFELDSVEVSEHDILRGAALRRAAEGG